MLWRSLLKVKRQLVQPVAVILNVLETKELSASVKRVVVDQTTYLVCTPLGVSKRITFLIKAISGIESIDLYFVLAITNFLINVVKQIGAL